MSTETKDPQESQNTNPNAGGQPPEPPESAWTKKVSPFAAALGLTLEEATAALIPLVGEDLEEGAALLEDPACTTDEMLKSAFPKAPPAKLMKAIRGLRGPAKPTAMMPYAGGALIPQGMALPAAIEAPLPEPPTDASFLDACRTGGVAKIPGVDVVAAVRAYMAKQLGVYDLPRHLLEMMRQYAERMEEPCSHEFYLLEKRLARRRFGYILDADSRDRISVSEREKHQLLSRLVPLFPATQQFHLMLSKWVNDWYQMAQAQGLALHAGAMAMGVLPPVATPDANPLVDAGGHIIDVANKVFAGKGLVTARAMAEDAIAIRQLVETPNLHTYIGVGNREEMLRTLGAGLTAEDVRTVNDLSKYVLAIYEIPNLTTEKLRYFLVNLCILGRTINWTKVTGQRLTLAETEEEEDVEDEPVYQEPAPAPRPRRGGTIIVGKR